MINVCEIKGFLIIVKRVLIFKFERDGVICIKMYLFVYLYILMKVINYCSIFYCNCIYLLNSLILVYVFGLRLLVIYEDVNMCMIEMLCG